MKWNWKLEAPQLALLAAMWLWALFAWPSMPDRIPAHWNIQGEIDRWGGKFEGLILLPLIATALYLLLRFLPLVDPGRANYVHFSGPYAVVRTTVLAMLAVVHAIGQVAAHGVKVPMGRLMPLLVGAMFVALGAVLGKVRPNWFVGVRTPWTLSSKVSWVKTHRMAGWLFMASGLACLASGLLLPPQWSFGVIMAGAIGSGLGSAVYSYFAWKSDPDKIPPAGTLPANGS